MRNIIAKLSPAQEKIVVQREESPLGTETMHASSAAVEPVTNGDAWKPAVAGENRSTNVRFMTESQPDSAITRFGHATLTLLFYALVLLYVISIFISYFTATPTEVNSEGGSIFQVREMSISSIFHEISRDFRRFREISRDFKRFQKISRDFKNALPEFVIGHRGTSP
jgi:hypothetical protein